MKDSATVALNRILGEQCSFITTKDLAPLLAEWTLHSTKVLIRRHTGRDVVTLMEVPEAVHQAGDDLRDVSFTADASAALRSKLGLRDPFAAR